MSDGDGNATTVDFAYNTAGTGLTYKTLEFGTGSALRTDHMVVDPATSTVIDWEITGLEPGGVYDLILFGQDGPQNESRFTIFGNTLTNDSEFDGNATGIVADAMGEITGTHEFISAFSSWDGLQIRQQQVAAAITEPSTMVLLGIGLVGLVGFGRRRRRRSGPNL